MLEPKLANTRIGDPTLIHPFAFKQIVTSTSYVTHNNLQTPCKTSSQRSRVTGALFYQNGQMGRGCQLGCPPYVEPNSDTANPHPFESSGQIDYPLALALDDSEVAESLELLDWWIARKHLAHFWAFSGMVVTNL